MTTHMLSMLMGNQSNVLARVVVLFCSRDVEVESLRLGPAGPSGVARLDVVVRLIEGRPIDGLMKQLRRLVDVNRVDELTNPRSASVAPDDA